MTRHRLAFYALVWLVTTPLAIKGAVGLQIEALDVPNAVKIDGDYHLGCHYHLAVNESLYYLRWYKDDREFFRFMPKETPSLRSFSVPGVMINLTQSTSKTVVLTNVDSSTSGLYRCEVSAEAPSFETDIRESYLSVVEPPKGKPFITVSKGTLGAAMNESVTANCSGPAGRPTPKLTWTLAFQSIPMDNRYIRHWLDVDAATDDNDVVNWERTMSSVNFSPDWLKRFMNQLALSGRLPDFIQGPFVILPLRCTSNILGLFEQSDTINIRIRREADQTTTTPANRIRDAGKQSQSSSSTLHGAFTNASPSGFSSTLMSLTSLAYVSLLLSVL